jgi:hypothetical protein
VLVLAVAVAVSGCSRCVDDEGAPPAPAHHNNAAVNAPLERPRFMAHSTLPLRSAFEVDAQEQEQDGAASTRSGEE